MKATNKQEFFDLLGYELNRIGIEDTKDIFADFEEHFSDSAMQGIPEDITAERLGDIKEIARSYLNLESSRINSIIARDTERKKVSLTKPGRDVPADLSLMHGVSNKDILNSDNIREYTPEHFSEEIYPNSARTSGENNSSKTGANPSGASNTNTNANTNNNSQSSGEKTVADAFSEAGRAALDAAKITGHAIADAFGHSGVKDAVVGAGKSAADAVKTAGQSAADAMRKAKEKHESRHDSVPHPTDSFRENINSSRKGTIPPNYHKSDAKAGYKLIDVSELKADVNAAKLAIALLLDLFLWSWLLPLILSGIIAAPFGVAGRLAVLAFEAIFGVNNFHVYYYPSRLLLSIAFVATAIILVCIGIALFKLFFKLIKFVINTHIKAIYDL